MSSKVQIDSGIWYKTEISGTFPMAARFKKDFASKREGYVWVDADFSHNGVSKKTRIAVDEKDIQVLGVKTKMNRSEIDKDIADRFHVMEILVDGIIDNTIKSLIVSGAAGIGKTYTIDKKLLAAEKAGKISKFSMIGGSCTAVGLYLQLWKHQNVGNVLVLDDLDSIFDDQEALNLLKGALDTGRTRTISWLGAGKFLEQEGADDTFEFNGTVVFITNHNFDDRIAKGVKLSPHYEALVSRCMYLDLGIHTMEEVLVRINQVIKGTKMMENLGMTESTTKVIMDWLMANLDDLRKVDLRTLIKLSQAMKSCPNHWKIVAKAALCKRG